MQVSLKNIGDALRIVHDMNNVARQIRPGVSITVDMHEKQVRKLQRAQNEKKDSIEVTVVDDAEQVDGPERRSEYTLGPEDGAADKTKVDRMKSADQPKSLAEIENSRGMPSRAHTDEPDQGDEIEHDLPDGQKPSEERVRVRPDKIAAVAKQANKEAPKEKAPDAEPSTAQEVLAKLGTLGPEDAVRFANKVLPKGTLPQKPKPTQILDALRKAAKRESKEAANQVAAKT